MAFRNFDEFITAFPNNLNIEAGIAYELYFQVFDNDVVNKYKNVKKNLTLLTMLVKLNNIKILEEFYENLS